MKLREPAQVNVDYDEYLKFVSGVTSEASADTNAFIERVNELKPSVDLNRLLTAAIGVGAEGGEFAEIVKKITFQGKPYDDASREHMIVELGDVMWYIARMFDMYDMTLIEVLHENYLKLTDRKERGVLKGDGDTR